MLSNKRRGPDNSKLDAGNQTMTLDCVYKSNVGKEGRGDEEEDLKPALLLQFTAAKREGCAQSVCWKMSMSMVMMLMLMLVTRERERVKSTANRLSA